MFGIGINAFAATLDFDSVLIKWESLTLTTETWQSGFSGSLRSFGYYIVL